MNTIFCTENFIGIVPQLNFTFIAEVFILLNFIGIVSSDSFIIYIPLEYQTMHDKHYVIVSAIIQFLKYVILLREIKNWFSQSSCVVAHGGFADGTDTDTGAAWRVSNTRRSYNVVVCRFCASTVGQVDRFANRCPCTEKKI